MQLLAQNWCDIAIVVQIGKCCGFWSYPGDCNCYCCHCYKKPAMCYIIGISWLTVRLCVQLLCYLQHISGMALGWEKLFAVNLMLLTLEGVPRKQTYAWERESVSTCAPLKFASKVTSLSRNPDLCILLLLVDPCTPKKSKRAQSLPSCIISCAQMPAFPLPGRDHI